jgi:uncharacterized protein (DUF362 family)
MAAKTGMTRREILTGVAGAAAASSLGGVAGCFPGVGGNWPDAGPDTGPTTCGCSGPDGGTSLGQTSAREPLPGKATVATIQRDDSIDSKGLSTDAAQISAVQTMVDAVLSALADGAANPWSKILPSVGACTRIGLKINCLNGAFPTTPAVVRAIIGSLVDKADVCAGNIIVWDRNLYEMNGSGGTVIYTADVLRGARLLGTLDQPTAQGKGPGYSKADYGTIQGAAPKLSRILTELTDVTINCPVFKVHGQTGVTGALKNIFGIIDCPSSFHTDPEKHQDIHTALPAIYNIPPIRNSIKLTVVDALRAVAAGDTSSMPNAQPGRIFASMDPLALDYYMLDLMNEIRAARPRNMPPVSTEVLGWMENAYQAGIGTKGYNLIKLQSDGTVATPDAAPDTGGED